MGSFTGVFNGEWREVSLGFPEYLTVASGVLTIPAGSNSHINVNGEGDATDQLDTITKADVQTGDFLLLRSVGSQTLTVDDANINLGANTRAIAPGGCIGLYYDGTEWTEMFYTAEGNNA